MIDHVLLPLQVLGYEGLLGTIMISVVGIPLTTFLPGTDQGAPALLLQLSSQHLHAINHLHLDLHSRLRAWAAVCAAAILCQLPVLSHQPMPKGIECHATCHCRRDV